MTVAGLRGLPGKLGRPAVKVPALPKVAEPFYQSREWIALRERRRADTDYAAAVARAKPGERIVLDHKRERRDGGADLDPANTEWLTHSEHQAKTARERARRAVSRGGGSKSG
ncbi:MAG: HNH endonuclease, partial [Caulobacteraceae bacterium]|nr:HNH endonuclease [Caulobacteraceae bacterium]